jgi:transglutaminase-like putative cysteine protease
MKEAEVAKAPAAGPIKTRSFLFTYAATITGLKPEQKVRIWLPTPPSNEDQDAKLIDEKGLPEGFKIGKEHEYGNEIIYVEAEADKDGTVPLSATYRVTRREVRGDSKLDKPTADELKRFLQADTMVPIDGKPLDLIKGKKLPEDEMERARAIYDAVNRHMKYDKPKDKPWGRGDSIFACQEGVGNCSDFHSLFISLVRSQKIPAKFEMGFPVPEKRGEGVIPGYHCWAKFKPEGKGWVPVDVSEANKNPKMADYYFGNLTENRVAFSVGRDVTLEPKQDGEPLNFFIYPYAEVDGKKYPDDKIQRKFSFKDVTE